MPRFFVSEQPKDVVGLSGEDGRHIARSLRMRTGEYITLCDGKGTDYDCEITSIKNDEFVLAQVRGASPSVGEPSLQVTVYQSLPKGDKMEWIAQKAVEAGMFRLVPMLSERCISRPDLHALEKKRERWQKIAEEAAKQCGRGIIPQVAPLTELRAAIAEAARTGPAIFFYEGGGDSLRQLVSDGMTQLSIFIGPEGGFSEDELLLARSYGVPAGSLGPRIFRTETASTAALAAIMALTGNM